LSSKDAIDLLKTEADRFAMHLSAETLEGLESYLDALASYNEKVNLVSDADPIVVVKRHILDCLAVVEVLNEHKNGKSRLLDIGSGAGLPGLIIAIACEQLEVVLLDSIGKKTRFLEETVKQLGLSGRVSVITGRAEELARTKQRASFDLATSRAVGHLGLVAELSVPLLKVGGRLLCQKSRNQVASEIKELEAVLKALGAAKPKVLVPRMQVSENEHVVVSLEKQGKTQDSYPRTWAEIIRQWK